MTSHHPASVGRTPPQAGGELVSFDLIVLILSILVSLSDLCGSIIVLFFLASWRLGGSIIFLSLLVCLAVQFVAFLRMIGGSLRFFSSPRR
jgi:hypothetical protein